MTRILMVCLGNICRSPLAEGILRSRLTEKKVSEILVDSAGTSDNHVGQHPDARSAANALRHGIDISQHLGRQFRASDFDRFDTIYAMDRSNYEDIVSISRTEADKSKVKLILNELHPGRNESVPDPYFGGEAGFEHVFHLLNEACTLIADRILLQ
jgi:protein-tyrosine phosphatase